jgi:hypothetical protein
MDLNPYVFSIDMLKSNLCFKLCFLFKKRHTISDSWITRLQINLIAQIFVEHFCYSVCTMMVLLWPWPVAILVPVHDAGENQKLK